MSPRIGDTVVLRSPWHGTGLGRVTWVGRSGRSPATVEVDTGATRQMLPSADVEVVETDVIARLVAAIRIVVDTAAQAELTRAFARAKAIACDLAWELHGHCDCEDCQEHESIYGRAS